MDQRTQRLGYPRNSHSQEKKNLDVAAPDNSAARECMNIGDSGEKTQDANRSAEAGSAPTDGGCTMPKANGARRPLDTEIAAYQEQAAELEASHLGKWVVFKDKALIAIHDTFEAAAEGAAKRFGRGPYLIRQIGAPPIVIPTSRAYYPPHEEPQH